MAASLGHVQTFMHPQVIITDDPSREDTFFTRAARSKAMELGRSLIELPAEAAANLMWITRLDSASLSGNVLEGQKCSRMLIVLQPGRQPMSTS